MDVGKTADTAYRMNPVRAEVSSPNGDNGSPDFEAGRGHQDVCLRARPWATPWATRLRPSDPDDDTLTYELDNDDDSTNVLAADSDLQFDLQFFDIDMETGQIDGGARAGLRRSPGTEGRAALMIEPWLERSTRSSSGPLTLPAWPTTSRSPSRPKT